MFLTNKKFLKHIHNIYVKHTYNIYKNKTVKVYNRELILTPVIAKRLSGVQDRIRFE